MFELKLSSSACSARLALLREPCAGDELLSDGAGPTAVTEWLGGLLLGGSGAALGKDDVWRLSLSDRDRIVALLHAVCFGDRVESRVTCSACRDTFEVDFSLASLIESLESEERSGDVEGPDEHGKYRLAGGGSFRLPTTDDERAVAGLPIEEAMRELVRRCAATDQATSDYEKLDRAMAAVAPVVDLDFTATCAVCGVEQTVHFDLVSFFVAALARERPLLMREIHKLALAYHWSRAEILALPRSVRRAHVALIEAEHAARRGAA